jgi:hypothetical protein
VIQAAPQLQVVARGPHPAFTTPSIDKFSHLNMVVGRSDSGHAIGPPECYDGGDT